MTLVYPERFSQARLAAAVALTRFGYGARPGEIDRVAGDPAGWLLAQLEDDSEPTELAGLPQSPTILANSARAEAAGGETLRRHRQRTLAAQHREAGLHILPAIQGRNPYRERLVRFWAEFFGIGLADPVAAPYAHVFEREVIRPNLMRRYYDMLLAALRHPAMLLKTNNVASFAKRSPAGRDRQENLATDLARLVLEDYTLGPGGVAGATWRGPDLLALAQMFTGWTLVGAEAGPETAATVRRAPGLPATFRFDERLHAEGSKYFLGRNYPAAGVLEAEAALDTLCRTPAVARRLATLMARWFVADDPPDVVVEDLVDGYAQFGGSLGGMATALATSLPAFEPGLRKLKRPDDLVISIYRCFDLDPGDGTQVVDAIAALGLGPKDYAAPNAVATSANHWLEPTRFADRLDWAAAAAVRARQDAAAGPETGVRLGFELLGPTLSEQTFRRLAVALDAGESAALLVLSPEFQTR
ncbi:MAG: DUF1800 domain-containing protein [Alphaproteobacteria bacterium]|nr:DUF1800 domain-containing protein [Alphaproteobacteria bacterium]